MDYVGRIFRPPSEAKSLLLQVTVGCSHNRCVYCDMYRDKQFRPKALEQIEQDLAEAASYGPVFDRVFLCDGDALILSTKRLLQILNLIQKTLPWVTRVGTYGDTRSVLKKTVRELCVLKEHGLSIVYHGVETGCDEVMTLIDKGATVAEVVETADRLREAGISHSVIVLLGIGGTNLSHKHSNATAKLLSRIDPEYVGALTTTVVPNTPLAKMVSQGELELPDRWTMLEELRTIVQKTEFTSCRFSANHASNYLPIRGTFPTDQERVLSVLDRVLETRDESWLRPDTYRRL